MAYVTMTVQASINSIMAQDKSYLIWIDMEMSGLNPLEDTILEVALVVTDNALNTVQQAPVLVLHQAQAVLDKMDAWNKSTHAKSGLIDKVQRSAYSAANVEAAMLEFSRASASARHLADVRQFDPSGPALSRGAHAAFGKLFSLSQFGREHAQGTG